MGHEVDKYLILASQLASLHLIHLTASVELLMTPLHLACKDTECVLIMSLGWCCIVLSTIYLQSSCKSGSSVTAIIRNIILPEHHCQVAGIFIAFSWRMQNKLLAISFQILQKAVLKCLVIAGRSACIWPNICYILFGVFYQQFLI